MRSSNCQKGRTASAAQGCKQTNPCCCLAAAWLLKQLLFLLLLLLLANCMVLACHGCAGHHAPPLVQTSVLLLLQVNLVAVVERPCCGACHFQCCAACM
jgi:hypothetical protein